MRWSMNDRGLRTALRGLLTLGLIACGASPAERPIDDLEAARAVDPADLFESLGPFVAGRFTLVYMPVDLFDAQGQRLHPEVPRADRVALAEADRRYVFELKASPLQGRADRVNVLMRRAPLKVTLDAAAVERLERKAKASEVVDVWAAHAELTRLVEAHSDWFGGDPQAVYQIPHGLRDQATWFRFDRVATAVDTALSTWKDRDWAELARRAADPTATGAVDAVLEITGPDRFLDAAFPKLRVPLVWHAVGDGRPGLERRLHPRAGVPSSSVVLFHELSHIGECRASDGYSEANANRYLEENPREAAVVELLGRTVKPADAAAAVKTHLPGPELLRDHTADWVRRTPVSRGVNVSTLLLRNRVSERAVGKVLGEPNVLPDDPEVIEAVWMRIPGFRERLWTPEKGAPPREGDHRIVRGGLYIEKRAFVRVQSYERGAWRDCYMADSHNPEAPVGPVLGDCLGRLARRIDTERAVRSAALQ